MSVHKHVIRHFPPENTKVELGELHGGPKSIHFLCTTRSLDHVKVVRRRESTGFTILTL